MDPYKIDFFSLKVFAQVFELRSFSGTAAALDLNQSVVSYTIDRLRKVFGDPLFLRQGGGIVPTDRCETLYGQVVSLLDQYDGAITSQEIDPNHIDKNFRISCNFFERVAILPHIVKLLRAQAPNASLTVIQAGTSGVRQLSQGNADLLIGPIRPDGDDYYCRTLLRDRYACVMDRANPLAEGSLTLQAYLSANAIEISYGQDWTSDYAARLSAVAQDMPRVAVTVPSPGDIQRILSGTDLIATVPRRYARMLQPQLHVAELPFETELNIDLVWSQRTHTSAMQKWFRDLVVEAGKTASAR